jgi:glycosyltransferase involved in cell wall biosynthesis
MRVALVVQRYGAEVNGGSETHARLVAELLAGDVELTVLTSCALDYTTWANHYAPGPTEVNGVSVLRFPVTKPRSAASFRAASAAAFAAPGNVQLGRAWMSAQGPRVPALHEHLDRDGYDAVAFMTYLYATTVEGLPRVSGRSVLVPTVHDEPPLRLRVFDEVFAGARVLLFNTPEERALAERRFGVEPERARIAGVGVSDPPPSDPERFRREAGVERPYVLYVGRLDRSKGVDDLVRHHARYRAAHPEGLDLVLVGSGPLRVSGGPWLHTLGFVSEQLKHDALAGAAVVAVPSPYESLSMAQLEAWSHGRPTLANEVSPVLVGQSRRSGGGLWYGDAEEYAAMLGLLARARPLADAIGGQGRRHVRRAYTWDRVRDVWLEALATAAGGAT